MCIETDSEITTLVHKDQLAHNRYYVSSIIDIVTFLAINHLPFRGDTDAWDSAGQTGSGLFLSLFEFTLEKYPHLAKIIPAIPRNATYTSHEIQYVIIELMSRQVTEHIVEEIGNTQSKWMEPEIQQDVKISIVLRFLDETYAIKERLLTIATSDAGDAKTLTQTLISEIRKAGLTTDKIISQVYDGASLMSGKLGGVQALLQDELGREIPYVHCFNHQLHLVIVLVMSAERAIEDLVSVCNALYKFTRKPTVAARYKGNTLKRLLEQRWAGHLATVEVILKSFQEILEVLDHVENTPSFPADTRMEAAGLRSAVSKPSFCFHALVVQKILAILEPPNRMLQSEEMDLQTAVQLVNSARECILALRTEEVFMELWKECCGTEANDTASHQSKRKCSVNGNLNDYILEQTSGARPQENQIKEQQRLFYSCIDAVAGEIVHRFGERNSKLIESMVSLNPKSTSFLDPERIKPRLVLTGTTVNEAEFVVACQRILKHTETFSPPNEGKWTIKTVLHHFHSSLEAMPSVITAYKAALTLGASTALCENSFSTLKNVFSEHRRSMLHTRKACLIQLAFEKDLTRKCKTEWKDRLLRRFHSSGKRRLQLYYT
ncbi:zinc finger MYM-type protein 1-like [Nothobranchius furzeri]|uniref:zinc finger MYM-type protein 1-like n=1 Tax=Nothobranchius furzeri TaxID=105023 RepID=UPI002403A7B5|nr:uncharacterized protein LOC107380925 [Nothobranchius furzeri]XP_054598947.1 uncharacterized protein LOC107380925 [Nothobranchius furzeri]XP_054598948.1 uncharacterized protein LOC107380925 [Nothobranchius furzeri]